MAEVSLLRQMECGLHCDGACAGCSAKPPQEILALASNAVGAEPGDFVEVEPAGGRNISTSVAVFLLPCVGLGAGYALGMYVLGLNELTSMLTAALGLAAGFLPAVLMDPAGFLRLFQAIKFRYDLHFCSGQLLQVPVAQ